MKKTILSAALLALFLSVHAQERTIDEVELTGKLVNMPFKKSNVNITVITKSEIQNSPAQSIEEVIAYYTGADIRKRGANGVQTDISFRGSSFEQVLVLVNGVRMNDAQTGHNTMNFPFDLASVEKIEILKGPAARRYGQGAYAGVVNVVTKVSAENNLTINGEVGDFSTHGFGVAANFGGEKFRNFIQVNNTESNGYRYNTDYKIKNIWYQNQFDIENGNVKFQAGIQEKKFGANGFYASPAFKDQYEEVQTSLVAASLEKKVNENLGFATRLYWRRAQDMYLFIRNNPAAYRNMHIGNNVGIDANVNYKSELGITGLGVDVRKEFLESNRLGSRERTVTNAFLEHHLSFFDEKLNITPGISFTSFSNDKTYFYPGIDASFTNGNSKFFGNFSKVNRIPTYTDLYYVSPSEQGNANLVAEEALTGEFGYIFKTNKTLLKASAFWRKSDNAIDWQKATPTSPWTAQNIGKIETKGVELEAVYQFASWIGTSVGYTYIDNQRLASNIVSRYSLDNLKHQLVAKLRNKFGNFSNELIYRHNDRVSLGSYNLLDNKLNYTANQFNIYVLVNNITNVKYTETSLVEMPGTWFHLGFTYQFKL
jgi:iron complex outermembrane receptor protein